jgi:hypothetical protein
MGDLKPRKIASEINWPLKNQVEIPKRLIQNLIPPILPRGMPNAVDISVVPEMQICVENNNM